MKQKIAKTLLFIPFILIAYVSFHYIQNFIELISMYDKYSTDKDYAYKLIQYVFKLTGIGMISNLILNQLNQINKKEV